MLVNAKFIALAAFATLVAGQTPDPCILGCSKAALGSVSNKSCTAYTDPCVCTDKGFQAAAGLCLQKNCTAQDQQTSVGLQKVLCGNTTTSGGGSSNSTNSTTSASSSASMSASASGSAASSSQSSAAGAQIQTGQTGLFALGVAAAGAVVGGLLI